MTNGLGKLALQVGVAATARVAQNALRQNGPLIRQRATQAGMPQNVTGALPNLINNPKAIEAAVAGGITMLATGDPMKGLGAAAKTFSPDASKFLKNASKGEAKLSDLKSFVPNDLARTAVEVLGEVAESDSNSLAGQFQEALNGGISAELKAAKAGYDRFRQIQKNKI
ncbi:MAG: hypothetical protein AAF621_00825 [Pseudomonadota bacterium]